MGNFQFEIGGKYENEKGVYEVLSIDERNAAMVIRWEDGKETSTSMELQRRIIARRHLERELEIAKAVTKQGAKKKKDAARRSGFLGFKETDFSQSITGTTWRKQGKLGNAVTTRLRTNGLKMKSRAVSRLPEVHWKDIHHQERNAKQLQAKFFVRLAEDNLCFGFSVDRSQKKFNGKDDWHAFMTWLKEPGNERWLKETAAEYDLRVFDKQEGGKPFSGQVSVVNGNWRMRDGDEEKDIESLADFIKTLPVTDQVRLNIANVVKKDVGLSRRVKIAEDISGVFDALMPLYKASIGPR